ncbi:MAG: enoyl-CoA hydratase-related protein, partial [Oscillospiraceae bacterium]
ALACDLIVAAENARFIQSFSTVGLIPDCGGSLLLTRAVGPWRARQLMFTAEPVSAAQGRDYGFVTGVYAPDALREETARLAATLASRAPRSLAGIKRMVGMAQDDWSALERTLAAEAQLQGSLIVGEDAREGMRAFFEKRAPEFGGRS